jgi:hypothetical protein
MNCKAKLPSGPKSWMPRVECGQPQDHPCHDTKPLPPGPPPLPSLKRHEFFAPVTDPKYDPSEDLARLIECDDWTMRETITERIAAHIATLEERFALAERDTHVTAAYRRLERRLTEDRDEWRDLWDAEHDKTEALDRRIGELERTWAAEREFIVETCLASRKRDKESQGAMLRDELLTRIDPLMSITARITDAAKKGE